MQAPHSGNERRARKPQGMLARLLRNNAGNTMAIVGAALLPITAMIGSGLDMSRAYMAKSRLQSACDAASLAARRVMKNDELSANVTQTGLDFFNFNFPQGLYETDAFEPNITKPETGLVRIAASTRIPTTVMKLFGFATLPLEVNCEASLNFVNTDVVLVLDVTGSMEDPVKGSTDTTPKIEALRDAVLALYDELAPIQTQLQSQGLRLRYGVVPYSSTVNVGRLIYEKDADYITSETPYQTREAYMNTASNGQQKFTNWVYREATLDTSEFKKPGGTIKIATSGQGTVSTAGYYNPQQLAKTGIGVTSATPSWNGCIEERRTINAINASSGFTIPENAYDLDINKVPDGPETRWRPMLPEAVYRRASGTTVTNPSWTPSATGKNGVGDTSTENSQMAMAEANRACPYEARRLGEWERSDLDEYLDDLQPIGGTYHDIGMIWGARLISTGGIFGDGCEEYNGMPCNRHVIFMTDGQQTAYCNVYSAYGVERNDKRVMGANNCKSDEYNSAGVPTDPATTELLARHTQRFKMICNATKNMNVSIWVVAFGTTLNATLTGCASNPSQAKTSTNSAQLITQFREIGNQIGALRLTR